MTLRHYRDGTFVVVASGEAAKTFHMRNGSLQHAENWNAVNLEDEGPSGKSPPDASFKDIDEATFSKQIARRLFKLAHAGKFDQLVLMADPRTLGEIRPLLHQEVTEKLVLEQAKTLINAPVDVIERSLRH
tara:strand:- start:446 stop:838 length:393 start_codon:yes stop_codon:yes gene_type:complete